MLPIEANTNIMMEKVRTGHAYIADISQIRGLSHSMFWDVLVVHALAVKDKTANQEESAAT